MLHVSVLKDHHRALKYAMNYLSVKSYIIVHDDGPEEPKHVAFIDYIVKSLLCLTVIYMPILIWHSTTVWIPLKVYNFY